MAKKIYTADEETAPKFRDAQGRVWHPRVTCRTCAQFERAKDGKSFFDPETLKGVMEKARMDDMLTLAYLACVEEVEERKVSQRDFEESIATAALYLDLSKAVSAAAALFSPSPAQTTEAGSAAPGTGATSTN